MDDYPRTLPEFEARFSTDEACRDYLFRLRWPRGFSCPRCGHSTAWPMKAGLFRCAECDYKASVIAGTIFERTRKPLTLWFRAIWWVTTQKNGASALGLQRILGLGSYETAWTWLHKLRSAMVRPGRDRLSGRVEVDETYVGGKEKGAYGRAIGSKALVVIAAEEKIGGPGRIRMRQIPAASAPYLHGFLLEAVEPGSVVHTDGWAGYNHLESKGYVHEVTLSSTCKESPSTYLSGVHRVASLLKRWLIGTHQGAVSKEHLDYYLDEFTFRFNRRRSRHRGKLFYRLLQQAVDVGPLPYKDMVQRSRENW